MPIDIGTVGIRGTDGDENEDEHDGERGAECTEKCQG
jgi:hypothetical protein